MTKNKAIRKFWIDDFLGEYSKDKPVIEPDSMLIQVASINPILEELELIRKGLHLAIDQLNETYIPRDKNVVIGKSLVLLNILIKELEND